jgi:hypothetical protein
MASSGAGSVRVRQTTPLLTVDEAKKAMSLAGESEYPLPSALRVPRELGIE